jgi:fermentation-respiration switch protein FrsA (DUF1100 family)
MKKVLLSTVIAVSVLLLVVNVFFYLQQPHMVFFPLKEIEQTPDQWGMHYEKVSLKSTHDHRITGWYIPGKNHDRALLFFHGNGGNISHRGDSLRIFHHLGLNVLIIDYQGYGESEGTPGEQAMYDDGRAAFDYLVKDRKFKKENIVVFGRSLGGAVAARITAEKRPGAVILESTFASVPDVASYYFPLLSKFIVSRYRFNSLAQVKKIHCPLLVLHSRQDDVIPFTSGARLYNAANNPRRFIEMVGDHNSGFIQSQPAYEDAIASFLRASGK